jgi:hypothetical protein
VRVPPPADAAPEDATAAVWARARVKSYDPASGRHGLALAEGGAVEMVLERGRVRWVFGDDSDEEEE